MVIGLLVIGDVLAIIFTVAAILVSLLLGMPDAALAGLQALAWEVGIPVLLILAGRLIQWAEKQQ